MKVIKNQRVTIRMTTKEKEILEVLATEANQHMGRFLVEKGMSNLGLTNTERFKVYATLQDIKDAAYHSDMKRIKKGCDEIWLLLK